MTERTPGKRTYVKRGATIEERLRHIGWNLRTVRPDLGPCWQWAGSCTPGGYPKVYDGTKIGAAHRLAYETWNGPIPAGHSVCHHCDNRACINPDHLFTGTTADNLRDMRNKGRQVDPVKLTDDDVAAIRAAYTGTRGEQTQLANHYGVSVATISLIVRGLHRTERSSRDEHLGDRGTPFRTPAA